MMRIKEPAAKLGYVVAVAIGLTLTTVPLAAVNLDLGFAWGVLALVAAVVVAARTFRGAGESDAPRPWWKMTSTRGSGILLAALFFIQGVTTSVGVFTLSNPPLALVGAVVALTLSAFSLNSAIRTRPVPASA
ncbi:hypothetical protein HCX50_08195 [Microbacterium oxydans]|uniref:hypothetical protein n=1 Tax=unclassified Microbacterium TaxID=2609290 RepID=UPI00142F8929|nr:MULTISPECIES: hypothetical protein [unclassified Microbacterium]MBT2495683.1 hypothetical protein [Microbacterium sp. ISL-59]NJI59404.1 hypothetical protein [Microbacterium sp. B19(2022)]